MGDRWSHLTTRILAPNPGPMSLDGTNTYVVRAPGSRGAVVVDPGPDIREHLDRIHGHGPVDLILLTHHHRDHAESAATLATRTGAPVRAAEPSLNIGAQPLHDGEVIEAAGTRIVVVATPGHTADSVCLHLPEDRPADSDERSGSVLTGDTILGRGTTILAQPVGAVRDYLRSLEVLRDLPAARLVLPAHGPRLPSLRGIAEDYLVHRQQRLTQVVAALAELDVEPSRDASVIARVTDMVYPHVGPSVRFAAEASVSAQLEYLAGVDS
jgi:glyoxylase-like metal-dependent hydrolase (beta-lactamase superfamily II)